MGRHAVNATSGLGAIIDRTFAGEFAKSIAARLGVSARRLQDWRFKRGFPEETRWSELAPKLNLNVAQLRALRGTTAEGADAALAAVDKAKVTSGLSLPAIPGGAPGPNREVMMRSVPSEIYDAGVDSLKDHASFLETHIPEIRDKTHHSAAYWNSLLRETTNKLELAGHALNKWVGSDSKEVFKETLCRIAENGGEVHLLMMKPNGKTLKSVSKALDKLNKFYNDRVIQTLEAVYIILQTLPEAHQSVVEVRYLDSDPLPYMLVGTDEMVVVSPYLARSPSDQNWVFPMSRTTPRSSAYLDDFKSLFKDAEPVRWEMFDFARKEERTSASLAASPEHVRQML